MCASNIALLRFDRTRRECGSETLYPGPSVLGVSQRSARALGEVTRRRENSLGVRRGRFQCARAKHGGRQNTVALVGSMTHWVLICLKQLYGVLHVSVTAIGSVLGRGTMVAFESWSPCYSRRRQPCCSE